MKLPLVYYPDPRLNEPSKKVREFSGVQKLCSDLIDTMEASKGIGISAVQIGELLRVAIIHKDADKELNEHLVIINPKIFSASPDMEEGEEGCLSIPGVFGQVPRHKKIKVRFADVQGTEQKIKATGLFSRVLQHEIDHMDGILFIERASKITKGEDVILEPRTRGDRISENNTQDSIGRSTGLQNHKTVRL
ncbi:MAG: peptide deformylase [Parcubacteria group bacterium]|nr:peptide deformylase [Parcubacteria group bacterium]